MARFLVVSVLFFLTNSFIFAQTEKQSAPVNWERCKISDSSVSVLFPKLPVKFDMSDNCEERETSVYSAYAEEVVYKLIVHSKFKEKIPKYCTEKIKFGERTLSKVVKEKKQIIEDYRETNLTQSERKVIKFTGKTGMTWIFDDLKNNRIYDLSLHHRDDVKPDRNRFVESIDFKTDIAGIEIGIGALRTLGDWREVKDPFSSNGTGSGESINTGKNNQPENLVSQKNDSTNSEKVVTLPIMVVTKPKPRYTEAARYADVQDSVALSVVFLAYGEIGSISPVKTLPLGLTEQAIAAAMKIAFLPQKRNGVPVTVVKTIEYNFSIY